VSPAKAQGGSFRNGGLDKTDQSVSAAVRRDLESIRLRNAELADSALACTALALAREMDDDNSATSKSMCAKAIIEAMRELRELCPPLEKADGLDDLASRRLRRFAGKSTA
jgi:hypothetical protein